MELLTLVMILAAYLIGSISSAILLCKIFALPDPRSQGSNNPGATNIVRMGHKKIAIGVLIFDVLKGTIPVWSAYHLAIPPNVIGLVALAACLGHMYPIFFQFRGGKAVATAFGIMLPLGFWLSVLLIITWLTALKISRYSSVAAITTVLLAPCYTWFFKPAYVIPVLMLSGLIIFRHRDNIYRLLAGTEHKVPLKK